MFNVEDFAAANDIPADEVNVPRYEWLLIEAEALVRAYRPGLPDDMAEWPNSAVVVLMRVVSRGYGAADIPSGASQQQATAGPFSVSTSFSTDSTSGGLWLTRQDRILLRGRGGGAYAVDTLPADRDYRSAAFRHCDGWVW